MEWPFTLTTRGNLIRRQQLFWVRSVIYLSRGMSSIMFLFTRATKTSHHRRHINTWIRGAMIMPFCWESLRPTVWPRKTFKLEVWSGRGTPLTPCFWRWLVKLKTHQASKPFMMYKWTESTQRVHSLKSMWRWLDTNMTMIWQNVTSYSSCTKHSYKLAIFKF